MYNSYRKTPAEMAAALEAEATLESNGGYRWKSSGNYVPKDYVEIAGVSGEALARHQAAYDADLDEVLANYRKANKGRKRSAEEMFEMRAAFGPGETVVDAITGERFTT